MTILQKAAKMNKRKLDLDADEIKIHEERSEPFLKSLKSLFCSWLLVRRLFVLAFCLYVFVYIKPKILVISIIQAMSF
jgi:hypothetical protein